MPVAPTYPGVYVLEVPSGVRTIAGVGTSTALFIGRTGRGRMNRPVRITSYTDFVREFSENTAVGDMARYVRLFFLNGGTDAYVLRIANGATSASVTLRSEDDQPVLELTAKEPGVLGETIRAVVTYAGTRPEATFNLQLFRWVTDATGRAAKADVEEWKNLTLDPTSPLYAPDFLTQQSKLVNAAEAVGIPAATAGYSQSGRPVAYTTGDPGDLLRSWKEIFGTTGAVGNRFEISVDGSPFIGVDFSAIDFSTMDDTDLDTARRAIQDEVAKAIDDALEAAGFPGTHVTVTVNDGPPAREAGKNTTILRITSQKDGDIFIRPSATDDLAVPLMLGTEQGGLEVGAHAGRRPAPNGISIRMSRDGVWQTIASRLQDSITEVRLDELQPDGSFAPVGITVDLATTGATQPFYVDGYATSATGHSDGVREKLGLIRDAINAYQAANAAVFFWRAELWGTRLAILPVSGADNWIGSFATEPSASDLGAVPDAITTNVRHYSVGVGGTAGFQDPAAGVASDGSAPRDTDYAAAYEIVDREVDLFNLLVLPPDAEPAVPMTDLWGPASVFCRDKRAFLLMDAPTSWTDAQAASTGVAALRAGLVKDHAAIFFPRVIIREGGRDIPVGASGAVAGLMARIDGARGVWKAPAGLEADLRGVVGVERRLSDRENGIVNPRAVNAIRVFPNGIVNWGARTMDGDDDFASEWKYIPVRRLALFIEESLYRGLKWVVFEPNDEGLWAQIRLNVGAFMHNLFRQGAFQGQKPADAYFVKCDAETTTQTDRNLGIVNIWVGFAPLKPAEFVVLYLQQMAGQVQV